jgi:predicted phosphodiesterase
LRILVTADLHYDIPRSREPARAVAEEICRSQADVVLVLGDVAGRNADIVRDCLRLFDGFPGAKLFVAGNHDIWTDEGECSLERFEVTLPAICRETGFHPLDMEPLVIGDVGFAGSMGWYDYGYRPKWLNVPLRFYEEKVAPGAAARFTRYRHLLARADDVPESAMGIGARWMDGEHARLPMSDIDFCGRLLDRFTRGLTEVASRCERIVAGFHHVPFTALVPANHRPSWAFASAYLGSERFGEAVLAEPKVRYAFCGHSHLPGRVRAGHVECINVGCTYREKRYEVVEV